MSLRLREAASNFFRGPHRLSLLGRSPGSSSSVLARVETDYGSWCLRGWPPGYEDGRLRFVHRVLTHSREAGFSGVPKLATTREGETLLNLDGRLFDAQEWLPGAPLSGEPVWDASVANVVHPLRPPLLSSLARAVARFHGSTVGFDPGCEDQGGSVLETFARVARETEVRREALFTGVLARPETRSRDVALRWLELLPTVVALAESGLRRHPADALAASTLCHGDLWAPHVHFDGPAFAGLVDFEGVHFGSPAFDLAQLILHFNGWSSRDAVLRAYKSIRPLRAGDVSVLPILAAVDLASEGIWSLGLLYGGRGHLAPIESRAHEANLDALLGSLEMIILSTEGGLNEPL